jgi:radical SAM superfamily enzyme YgiQ (UPF0313 family)
MSAGGRSILLVEPPFNRLFKNTYSLDRFPLALGYLSGVIREQTGWTVAAYNADFSSLAEPLKYGYLSGEGFRNYRRALADESAGIWAEVRSVLTERRPGVVGISSKSQNFASACRVARIAKEVDPAVIVVVGGPHASMVGADVLKCPDIDVAVQGEGERTVVELLRAIEAGGDLGGVAGIACRGPAGVVQTPPRPFIDDLDALPVPHAHAPEVLVGHRQYPVTAFKYVFATRGCPYQCTFCGSHRIWSRRVRFRSPENVAAEIQGLQKMGLRLVHFDDDTFGIDRGYIARLCDAIASRCPGVRWSCELHVKLVDAPTLSRMKAAGCYSVQLGIESGNDEVLRGIRKNCTIQEALAAASLIKSAGLELTAFFMVGFPQETEQTLRDTLSAMEQVRADTVVFSIFTPYPGTEAFEQCRSSGLIADDFDVSLYNHHSPENCFSVHIPRDRFGELVRQAEKTTDRRNARSRLRRVLSGTTWARIRELGLLGSLRKAARTFLGR